MDCKQEENLARCPCTSDDCPRRGLCCDCLATHLSGRTFPACVFPADWSGKRSFEAFAAQVEAGKL